jgi:mono/diheme cytochrome c family protein
VKYTEHMPSARPWCCALFIALLCGSCARARPLPEGALSFQRDGQTLRTLPFATLAEHAPARNVETVDPYYGKAKRFRALPLAPLLAFAFGETVERLRKRSFVLYALDGYAVPIDGARLIDPRAYLAVDDLDVPGFAPIGPRQVSPAPAYLIWEGAKDTDLEAHPRPWQLTSIAVVDGATLYPHTLPRGVAADSVAQRGYQLFRERCIRCHTINREGGSVGPDLNVPQSIIAYRPEAQIRAYIQNPLTFRYGTMPPNPDLSERDLDALIAYFHVMASQPHDPAAKSPK